MSQFDDIKQRAERVKFTQAYDHIAQTDREYLLTMIELQRQALDLALPEMDYDERFKAVHQSIVETLDYKDQMDDTELANVLAARALRALEAKMDIPYE